MSQHPGWDMSHDRVCHPVRLQVVAAALQPCDGGGRSAAPSALKGGAAADFAAINAGSAAKQVWRSSQGMHALHDAPTWVAERLTLLLLLHPSSYDEVQQQPGSLAVDQDPLLNAGAAVTGSYSGQRTGACSGAELAGAPLQSEDVVQAGSGLLEESVSVCWRKLTDLSSFSILAAEVRPVGAGVAGSRGSGEGNGQGQKGGMQGSVGGGLESVDAIE